MAFNLANVRGYGDGSLGVVVENLDAGNVNSYARVTNLSATSVTIDSATAKLGAYEKFTAGNEIMFHVSAAVASTATDYLGRWGFAKILSVTDNVLFVDADLTQILPLDQFGKYHCQVVTVAQFESLTLNGDVEIVPAAYSSSAFVGGIVAIKCSNALTFDGGNINVAGRGIPVASKALRPVLAQEKANAGLRNYDKFAGWENHITRERLLLNAGDGVVFIAAKNFSGDIDSRIGNPAIVGEARKRAKTYSYLQGGATIFIAADAVENFYPEMICKSRSVAGQGLARCFIATDSVLPVDEGLYSCDHFTNPLRLMRKLNVRNFGNGSLGNATEITTQLNNYARVSAMSSDRKVLTYAGKTTAGLAQIAKDALVMIHVSHRTSPTGLDSTGEFVLARVLGDNGSELTIDTPAPNVALSSNTMQIVSIPQYNNFALSKENSATPKFDGNQGGIFAVAVKNYCNIAGGKINVSGKGGGDSYGERGLQTLGNVNMRDRLPIGQGNGSVFILAKELNMDGDTRIGALHSGANYGGDKYVAKSSTARQSGYAGYPDTAYTGSGQHGGKGKNATSGTGGFGSNGAANSTGKYLGGNQGAHIMIVADIIHNFHQAAISTGGEGGRYYNYVSSGGGAGYGGGGGYSDGYCGGFNGGGGGGASASGGGSTGWAFIYANTVHNQVLDDTLTE